MGPRVTAHGAKVPPKVGLEQPALLQSTANLATATAPSSVSTVQALGAHVRQAARPRVTAHGAKVPPKVGLEQPALLQSTANLATATAPHCLHHRRLWQNMINLRRQHLAPLCLICCNGVLICCL